MWPTTFEERLSAWHKLRQTTKTLDLDLALSTINDWWFNSPMINRHLHWDDHESWPSPWDLLADNMYCDLARALGMLYTIAIIDHPEVESIELVRTENDNLVLINQGKYILNWAPRQLLNITSTNLNIKQSLPLAAFKHLPGE